MNRLEYSSVGKRIGGGHRQPLEYVRMPGRLHSLEEIGKYGGVSVKRSGRIGDMVLLEPVVRKLSKMFNTEVVSDSAYSFMYSCPVVQTPSSGYYLLDLDDYVEIHPCSQSIHRTDLFASSVGIKLRDSFPRIMGGVCDVISGEYIVVAPYSVSSNRTWDGIWEVMNSINYKMCVVDHSKWVIDGVEMTARSINDLYSLICGASLVIAPDTGVMHLAGAARTPFIAMFTLLEKSCTDPQLRCRYYSDYVALCGDKLTGKNVIAWVDKAMDSGTLGKMVVTRAHMTISRGSTKYVFQPNAPLWVPEPDASDLLKSPEFKEHGAEIEIVEGVVWVISNLGVGGAEKHTLNLIKSLAKHNWEQTVVVLNGRQNSDVLAKEFGMYAKVVYGRDALSSYANAASVVIQVIATENDFAYRHKWATPTVAIVHYEGVDDAKLVQPNTVYVLTSGESDRDNVVTIPNGVDIDFWSGGSDLRKRRGMHTDDFVVLYVGRLSEEKGLFTLLEAVQILGVKLVIVGPGYLEGELKSKVSEWGMQENVEFRGYLGEDAIRNWMATADCLVLPSRTESMPLVILEAMAAGCPVVATKVGAVPSMLRDGNAGFLFDAGDVEGLIKCLNTIREDSKSTAMKVVAAKNVVEVYHNQQLSAAYYMDIIGNQIGEPLVTVIVTANKDARKTLSSILSSNYTNISVVYVGDTKFISDPSGAVLDPADDRVVFLFVDEASTEVECINTAITNYPVGSYVTFLRGGQVLPKDYIKACVQLAEPLQLHSYIADDNTVIQPDINSWFPSCALFVHSGLLGPIVNDTPIMQKYPNFWPSIFLAYVGKKYKSFISPLAIENVSPPGADPASVRLLEAEIGYRDVVSKILSKGQRNG